MKRVLSIIIVTVIIFLIGFAFLWVNNEEFAEKMVDDVGLNATRIRKHKMSMTWSTVTWSIMTWDLATGAMMSGGSMSGMTMTWMLLGSGETTWLIKSIVQ